MNNRPPRRRPGRNPRQKIARSREVSHVSTRRLEPEQPPALESPLRKGATARDVAATVIGNYREAGDRVADLLNRHARAASLNSEDRRLASELAFGVVRRQNTLDILIAGAVTRPRDKVETGLWTLLQLGTYQLLFLDAIPTYAAINETVETARHLSHPQWTGFLNGVLRGISRSLDEEWLGQPAANAIPISDGRYRKLREPRLADPDTKPAEYVAQAFSLPQWLVERWAQKYDFAELCRLGFWFNTPTRPTLRVNELRTSRAQFLDALKSAGIEARAGNHRSAVHLIGPQRIEELPGYNEGCFAVQDESAMQAGDLLAPKPGWQVLDLCAAPGTKTTHLAELMRNEGRIIAADVDPRRLDRVRENVRRLGEPIIEPTLIRDDGSDIPAGPFDAILVDVPCSNTGVLGKRPEVRWRILPRDLQELPQLQARLLSAAISRLKPGGRLVYSTCSIEPEENGQLVRQVLSSYRDQGIVELEQEISHVPGQPADGGYQALLTKQNVVKS